MIDSGAAIRDALLCAREESFLWELSQSLQARYPGATTSECNAAAQESARALLSNGWAELVATNWAEQPRGPVLSQAEAIEVLQEARNWCIPPSNQDPCFFLVITESGREQPF